MDNYIPSLTAELIRFPSVDANGQRTELKRVIDFVETRLKKLPGVFMKRFEQNKKPSLVVTFQKDQKHPTVFFNGHLDVVPANSNQFMPKMENGKLFGRGSHDMKGGCAVMIALIEHFSRQVKKPDAGFMFVTDEEFSGRDGSEMLLKKGYRPKLLIPLEPTNFQIITETKGMLWMSGAIPGKAAHGSMPWLGENPIALFHEGLKKFYKYFPSLKREKWMTTGNIGEVHSGDCFNRVPPELIFKIDFRYAPDDDPKKIIHTVKSCFPKNTKWTIRRCDPPHKKAKDFTLIRRLKTEMERNGIKTSFQRAPFCTDARFFSKAGVDCIVLGPVGAGMHGDHEWVDIKSLDTLFLVLKNFCETL